MTLDIGYPGVLTKPYVCTKIQSIIESFRH